MIAFWVILIAFIIWSLGSLAFFYHVLSLRYPRDIAPVMAIVFALSIMPLLIFFLGALADLYGGAL